MILEGGLYDIGGGACMILEGGLYDIGGGGGMLAAAVLEWNECPRSAVQINAQSHHPFFSIRSSYMCFLDLSTY